jgi:hypothetical protein
MELIVRRTLMIVDEKRIEAAHLRDPPLRKVTVAAILENPYAGRYVEDLSPMIVASEKLGGILGAAAVKAMHPYSVESYGKAGIVGVNGEQEHANALLTTTFANPIRDAIGGAKAWISSMTKIGGPGTVIDVPMNCKDEIYVRSHYDGFTVMLADAPLPDEIAVIFCLANRGRLNARVGGLKFGDPPSQPT